MNDWIVKSYNYVFGCIQAKKFPHGPEKWLHPNTQKVYEFTRDYTLQNNKFPTPKHYLEKFKIDYRDYFKKGYTFEELKDALRGEFFREIGQQLLSYSQHINEMENPPTPEDIQKIIDFASESLQTAQTSSGVKLSQAASIMKKFKEPVNKVSDFGFPMMDRYIGGISRGQYTVIFGAVSEGKSTFARLLAGNIAYLGKKVLYLTLEEAAEDSVIMTAALQVHYNYQNIFDNRIDMQVMRKTISWAETLQGEVVFIDKVGQKGSVDTLLSLNKEYQPDVIFLDQITLFTQNGSSEEKEITRVSRIIRDFCQRTGVPVVALTQRMRIDKRKHKDNDAGDLNDIGYAASIGQDADVILYVHQTDRDHHIARKKITIVKNKKRKRFLEINFEWQLDEGVIREIEDYADMEDDHD